jgi:uncharacterized membrane protein YhaH (DUF805 family)
MSWLQLLFSFNGRISRRRYWIGFALLLIGLVAEMALLPPDAFVQFVPLAEAQANPFTLLKPPALIEAAIATWIVVAVSAKRCHDRNHSGVYLLLYLVPLVGQLWILAELGFFPGTPGANRFGPDPMISASA